MQLYVLPTSPPALAVRLLAKHLELNIELIELDLFAGEHLNPDYMKISPFHTIPALNDNGFTLFESRAIMLYMLNKYAPESNLYPKDLKKRACVDAMLHFDNATLTDAFLRLVKPLLFKGVKANPEEYEKIHDCLKCLNNLLSSRQYAAGNSLTVADISIIHSLVWIEAVISKRHALKNPNRIWPNATVPYVIDQAYNEKQRLKILDAMKHIARVSCVNFVPREDHQKAFMQVMKGKGCSARLGFRADQQRRVYLGPNCMWSSRILHELMHILGFYHEQNRPDRDKYIRVYTQNILSRYKSNFKKSNPKHITTFGLPYDYHSILHYNSNGFAKNETLKTMTPLTKIQGKLGMGKTLTALDITKINRLYNCQLNKVKNEVTE